MTDRDVGMLASASALAFRIFVPGCCGTALPGGYPRGSFRRLHWAILKKAAGGEVLGARRAVSRGIRHGASAACALAANGRAEEAPVHQGRGFAFPCDVTGHVDLKALSERGRCNYLFAGATVGREFAVPNVSAA
ncbi:TPA: hypothetical protein RMS72_005375 [Raoultella ornithinolytica]|nr:hypothetical protein [Raoultella ornithinolytica]